MAMTSVRSTSCTEARMVVVRSTATCMIDAGREQRPEPRQLGADAVDRVDDVGARLGDDHHRDRRPAVDHPGDADVLHRSRRRAPDPRAEPPRRRARGHDQRQIAGGREAADRWCGSPSSRARRRAGPSVDSRSPAPSTVRTLLERDPVRVRAPSDSARRAPPAARRRRRSPGRRHRPGRASAPAPTRRCRRCGWWERRRTSAPG